MQDVLNSVILNSYPNANDVISIQSYRPNYLSYPARVTLRTIDGNLATCVLKGSEDEDKVLFEGAGAKAGLVERYLYKHNVAPQAFWVRLVLRGVSYLQQTTPADASTHMVNVITESVYRLRDSV